MPPNQAQQSGLGRLQLQLPPESGAPAAARRALRTLPLGDRADDVLLLASELVTNAVLHAGSRNPIELIAECRPDGTWVEVRDHGRGFESPPLRAGHGLQILTATSDRWGIVQDDATRVWFELR
jgi:nitrate/nitrite-specific signal transduction histidine kinase